jgi:hypothetical protein
MEEGKAAFVKRRIGDSRENLVKKGVPRIHSFMLPGNSYSPDLRCFYESVCKKIHALYGQNRSKTINILSLYISI